jgi:hypothetical protein
MAKKQTLRKQIEALEEIAGIERLTTAQAKRANGGRHHKKHKKSGTGAVAVRGTGAVAILGSGSIAAPIYPPRG